MIEPTRRKFIGSLIAFVAAPAIVRVGSLMPIKVIDPRVEMLDLLRRQVAMAEALMVKNMNEVIYSTAEWTPVTFMGYDPLYSFKRIYAEVDIGELSDG